MSAAGVGCPGPCPGGGVGYPDLMSGAGGLGIQVPCQEATPTCDLSNNSFDVTYPNPILCPDKEIELLAMIAHPAVQLSTRARFRMILCSETPQKSLIQ